MGEVKELGPPVPPVRNERRSYRCSHRQVYLNHENRRLYCDRCGVEVDPFDFLEYLAREWEAIASRQTIAERDAVRAETQLEDLKREIRNAKGRLRRALA